MGDIIILDQYGRTALHRAIQSRSSYEVEQLLANEALDTNYTSIVTNEDNYTVLHMVAIHWPEISIDLFRALRNRCTIETINAQSSRGLTALHMAIESHSITATRALLERLELDVNIRDIHGKTALDYARDYRSPSAIINLLQNAMDRQQ